MTSLRLFTLIATLLVPTWAWAQSLESDPRVAEALELVEAWVDSRRAFDEIPGISMAVVHDQELVWSRGFGYAHLEGHVAARPDTIYSICSISKLFTSIAVMQLRDQGKLRLDDPLKKHLPWFNIQQTHRDSAPITLKGILTHSSGLPRESAAPYWTGREGYPFPSRDEVIARLPGQQTLYPAATYSQYSNLGLTLAGYVVAATAKQPYAEYVQQHILAPLGLEDTSSEMPRRHKDGRLATGYAARVRDGHRAAVPFYEVRGMAPAFGFASTVEDLATFASWQLRLLAHGGTEVLAANTLKERHGGAGGEYAQGDAPGPLAGSGLGRGPRRGILRLATRRPDDRRARRQLSRLPLPVDAVPGRRDRGDLHDQWAGYQHRRVYAPGVRHRGSGHS